MTAKDYADKAGLTVFMFLVFVSATILVLLAGKEAVGGSSPFYTLILMAFMSGASFMFSLAVKFSLLALTAR